jgi:hypothetical protein
MSYISAYKRLVQIAGSAEGWEAYVVAFYAYLLHLTGPASGVAHHLPTWHYVSNPRSLHAIAPLTSLLAL